MASPDSPAPAAGILRALLALPLMAAWAVLVSARPPWIPRWLNADASARVSVREGRLALDEPRLRLARFEPGAAALNLLLPLVALAIRAERPVRRMLPVVRALHVEAGQLVVTCGVR
jgi:hypothetical protein